MRAVLDTNIVVSGLLWHAAPRQLLNAARERRVTLCTSSVLLGELADVLSRVHLARVVIANGASPTALMQRYGVLATVIAPAQISRVITNDADDDAVLACALAAGADLIVSGDAHLLNLKQYHGMRIVTAVEALMAIGRA